MFNRKWVDCTFLYYAIYTTPSLFTDCKVSVFTQHANTSLPPLGEQYPCMRYDIHSCCHLDSSLYVCYSIEFDLDSIMLPWHQPKLHSFFGASTEFSETVRFFPHLWYYNWCCCNQPETCQILVGNIFYFIYFSVLIFWSHEYHCQAVIQENAAIWGANHGCFGPVQKKRLCGETENHHYFRVIGF